jgi:tagaturonate reductase
VTTALELPESLPLLARSRSQALPIRVLQFGQGNFLRGFVDWQIDLLNERCAMDLGVVIVRPTSRSTAPLLDTQGGCYTTVLRGLDEVGALKTDVRVIQCVQRELDLAVHWPDYLALASNPDVRFMVSNTTEAGITVNTTDQYEDQPPTSFPAKLTRWLHARFVHFCADSSKGLILLPTELIEANGPALRNAVLHYAALWALEDEFVNWLHEACQFCSTLVDRIVTGYPSAEAESLQQQWGYRDPMMVAGERYHYWAIQAPAWVAQELPLHRARLNVQWVTDLAPIRLRKVAILNGAHTLLSALGLLAGLQTVGAAMADAQLRGFLQDTLEQEILPTLPFSQEDLQAFTAEVLLRFSNPTISHALSAIALNQESKFAARLLPQLLNYQRTTGTLPARIVLVLAALAQSTHSAPSAGEYLARVDLWGQDLNAIEGLSEQLEASMQTLAHHGVRHAMQVASMHAL